MRGEVSVRIVWSMQCSPPPTHSTSFWFRRQVFEWKNLSNVRHAGNWNWSSVLMLCAQCSRCRKGAPSITLVWREMRRVRWVHTCQSHLQKRRRMDVMEHVFWRCSSSFIHSCILSRIYLRGGNIIKRWFTLRISAPKSWQAHHRAEVQSRTCRKEREVPQEKQNSPHLALFNSDHLRAPDHINLTLINLIITSTNISLSPCLL